MSTVLALGLVMVLGQGYAPPREGQAPLDTEREARVQRLGKQLRCAVCQGVAISDSPASMARAQLDKVRELVAENKSDQEILDYFVARYGEWVLLEPTTGGLNTVLWTAPVGLLAVGLLLIWLQSKKRGLPSELAPAPSAPDAAKAAPAAPAPQSPDEDPYLAQVRADLEK